MSDANLNSIRTSGLPTIARVTSELPGSANWTTITIWHRRAAGRRPILIEVFGGTRVPGQHNRRRRRNYATIEDALGFLEPSRLADEARAVARRWCQMHAPEMMPAPSAADEE